MIAVSSFVRNLPVPYAPFHITQERALPWVMEKEYSICLLYIIFYRHYFQKLKYFFPFFISTLENENSLLSFSILFLSAGKEKSCPGAICSEDSFFRPFLYMGPDHVRTRINHC